MASFIRYDILLFYILRFNNSTKNKTALQDQALQSCFILSNHIHLLD